MSTKIVSIQTPKIPLFFENLTGLGGFPQISLIGDNILREYGNARESQRHQASPPLMAVFLMSLMVSLLIASFVTGKLSPVSWMVCGMISAFITALISGEHRDSPVVFQPFHIHLSNEEYRCYRFYRDCLEMIPPQYASAFAKLLKIQPNLHIWGDLFNANYNHNQLEYLFNMVFVSQFVKIEDKRILTDRENIIKWLDFELSCLKPYIHSEIERYEPIFTDYGNHPDIRSLSDQIHTILENRMKDPNFPVGEALSNTFGRIRHEG